MSENQRSPIQAAIHRSIGSEVYSGLNPTQQRQVESALTALEKRTEAAESSLIPGILNPRSPEHYGMRHGNIRMDATTASAINESSAFPDIGRESIARQVIGKPPLAPEEMATLRGTLASPLLHTEQRAYLNGETGGRDSNSITRIASLPIPETATRMASADVANEPSSPSATPAIQPKPNTSPER